MVSHYDDSDIHQYTRIGNAYAGGRITKPIFALLLPSLQGGANQPDQSVTGTGKKQVLEAEGNLQNANFIPPTRQYYRPRSYPSAATRTSSYKYRLQVSCWVCEIPTGLVKHASWGSSDRHCILRHIQDCKCSFQVSLQRWVCILLRF
jgi:hypothetical protein